MKKLSFIVTSKSFEKFMMMTILGTTGAAMDIQMNFFFTFWGLYLLKKKFQAKVEGMPFPMKGMATGMFKKKMKAFGIADPWAMIRDAVQEGKIKLYPCSMTMDMMGMKKEDFWDFVEEPCGAAAFLEIADGSDSILVL
ncbi:MAG TPA: DsrE/DsrF/DrsH-like family protein [Candidatus Lokiarchaeia archaeon]|nr:DsrE/DsrF/DrsH-like family protein [Candidatus Lokiarchaeia archaeon]